MSKLRPLGSVCTKAPQLIAFFKKQARGARIACAYTAERNRNSPKLPSDHAALSRQAVYQQPATDAETTYGVSNLTCCLVRLGGETSNQLFEVLADWNAQLTSCSLYENPEELPFQLDGAERQESANSANSDGEMPIEKNGSGSWTS